MGALTIKPYSFTYRPWEMEKVLIPNFFSLFPEMIFMQKKNQNIVRILPFRTNEYISNSLRFSFSKFFNFLNKTETLARSPFFNSLFIFFTNIFSKTLQLFFHINFFLITKLKLTIFTKFFYNVFHFICLFFKVCLANFNILKNINIYSIQKCISIDIYTKFMLIGSVEKSNLLSNKFNNLSAISSFFNSFSSTYLNVVSFVNIRSLFPDLLIKLKQKINSGKVSPFSSVKNGIHIFYLAKSSEHFFLKNSLFSEKHVSLGLNLLLSLYLTSFYFLMSPNIFIFNEPFFFCFHTFHLKNSIDVNMLWCGYSLPNYLSKRNTSNLYFNFSKKLLKLQNIVFLNVFSYSCSYFI